MTSPRTFWGLTILIALHGSSALASGSERLFYRELAIRHAPVIEQELGSDPSADQFTQFNFDGDTDAWNNWDDLDRAHTPAIAYYDVIESETHFFITYGFFYPRDYKAFCFWMLCHENDFEGIRLTVEKTPDMAWGKVVLLETLAHSYLSIDPNPETAVIAEKNPHPRVVIGIEGEGHGIHSARDFLPSGPVRTYRYGMGPDGYDLIPLSWFWERRESFGPEGIWHSRFEYRGTRFSIPELPASFGGDQFGTTDGANPPWAWNPPGFDLQQGDWFFDPAESVCRIQGYDPDHCPGFSMQYLFNPYVGYE